MTTSFTVCPVCIGLQTLTPAGHRALHEEIARHVAPTDAQEQGDRDRERRGMDAPMLVDENGAFDLVPPDEASPQE